MWNRKYGKKVVCTVLSAAMVLTLGSQTVLSTTMGTEDSLAGMSQTLDEYCENKQNGTAAPVAAPVSPAAVTPEQQAVIPEQPAAPEQQAVTPEQPKEEQKPEKKPSRLKNTGISIADEYVNIRKKPNTESKVVGKLYQGSAVKIEKKKGSWVKISSGSVTGYIKKEFLAIGKKAEKLEDKYGTKYAKVTTETLKVREKKSTDCTILTLVPEGERYLVKSQSKKWVKIEVEEGTVGYVSADYVKVYTRFKKAVSIEEEEAEARRKAEAAAAAAEAEAAERARQAAAQSASRSKASRSSSSSRSARKSSSSSSSSGSSSVSGGGNGSAIANYAVKFVGNPYSYGGTSLTNGADCSGFTMAVFRRFGISLPHGSGSQAGCGRKVSLSEAKPGDLVFYASGGRIHHVALYIGGGRIVHAKGKAYGIVTDSVGYNKVYCVRRVL